MNTDQHASLGNGHAISRGSSLNGSNVEFATSLGAQTGNGVSPCYGLHQESARWYLMRASYGQEQKACDYLKEHGMEVFCPKWKQERTYSGKKTVVEVSIIPNTLFVRSTEQELHGYVGKEPLTYFHHYYRQDLDDNRRRVGCGRKPITIPDSQMNSFMCWASTESDDKLLQREGTFNFKEGDLVRVTEGDFEGFMGHVVRYKGQTRVGVTINDVGTIFTAYIPRKLLTKIEN